ncbi:RNA 2',3'-cyclic phosphodiesterase [Kistimonas asteriae]|uniref:RNA 2',3'-cyclic phosphodiesterase n=1 Tax=Kistimonas asteriae TaxID=517724 RepID=UPI001BA5F5FA|nr:RNA 2',3'-cyclic phosphodiesterase [Kistimonas asteriae]
MKAGNSGNVRAFIAYRLPLDVSAALYKKARHHVGEDVVEKLRWVAPQDYHLTLRFLGHCTEEQLQQISSGLHEVLQDVDGFRCMTGEVSYFPSANHPRVMALMVHSGKVMERLYALCDELAVAAGIPSQSRHFRPHVTLARFPADTHRLSMSVWRLPGFHLTVKDIALVRSDLSPEGARYSEMETFPLDPALQTAVAQ